MFDLFNVFDPVNGEVPTFPFSQLCEIADRARRLVKGRTREELTKAAKEIIELIVVHLQEQYAIEAWRKKRGYFDLMANTSFVNIPFFESVKSLFNHPAIFNEAIEDLVGIIMNT